MKKIKLTQGKYALVDDDDFEYLNQWRWTYSMGYAVRNSFKVFQSTGTTRDEAGKRNYKRILMHREILGVSTGLEVDHIDHNGLDNRRSNIRVCTSSQNKHNQRLKTSNKSGFKGVCWCRRKSRWRSSIVVNAKQVHLGYFQSRVAAATAYDRAAKKYFGQFALTNMVKR